MAHPLRYNSTDVRVSNCVSLNEGQSQLQTDRSSLRFGSFELIPDRQALLHRGEPISLGVWALDILSLLVRRAGDIVSKS